MLMETAGLAAAGWGLSSSLPLALNCRRKGMKSMPIMNGCSTSGILKGGQGRQGRQGRQGVTTSDYATHHCFVSRRGVFQRGRATHNNRAQRKGRAGQSDA